MRTVLYGRFCGFSADDCEFICRVKAGAMALRRVEEPMETSIPGSDVVDALDATSTTGTRSWVRWSRDQEEIEDADGFLAG